MKASAACEKRSLHGTQENTNEIWLAVQVQFLLEVTEQSV